VISTILVVPVDHLPIDVLTELGRVTWAAIKLEDYVESVCSFIEPANPRTDMRQLGQKIKDAWTAPGILEALIPGRMRSHACTAEVPR
jgi:hypothetical protein